MLNDFLHVMLQTEFSVVWEGVLDETYLKQNQFDFNFALCCHLHEDTKGLPTSEIQVSKKSHLQLFFFSSGHFSGTFLVAIKQTLLTIGYKLYWSNYTHNKGPCAHLAWPIFGPFKILFFMC